ncbi:MAG: TonB-dependent receptor [Candidatus Dadabacteria bacterium]|nr:MAG: TonB-dependent receptor [Candidatus Dadabacteria bacterium]
MWRVIMLGRKVIRHGAFAMLCICQLLVPSRGFSSQPDLTQLAIEDLMDLEVNIASKTPERVKDIPAAVYVIKGEDLRRSGVTSIPEALRMVPGLDVGRVNSNVWAISSRGFSGVFANKLLVLIDGRTVYTPLFAGVFWDVQDVVLEDVDRIEVIRGPGASIWGANAVNGVINIVTKSSKDTQGMLVSGLAGNEEEGTGVVRYGGKFGSESYYRVYVKYLERDSFTRRTDEGRAFDAWDQARSGFRIDSKLDKKSRLTLQGDIYSEDAGQKLLKPEFQEPFFSTKSKTADISGGNIIARLERDLSGTSDFFVQGFYDRINRNDNALGQGRDTVDVEFRYHSSGINRHDIVWGGGYRLVKDELTPSDFISFDPNDRTTHLFNAFVQDRYSVTNKLSLTVGTKLERNSYTGFEIQPTARALYKLNEQNSVWASVSRAVRTPARSGDDLDLLLTVKPGTPPTAIRLKGDRGSESDVLVALEGGYRYNHSRRLGVDIAFFYNFYDNLLTYEAAAPGFSLSPIPHIEAPFMVDNKASAHTYGVELTFHYQPVEMWHIQLNYTNFQMDLNLDDDSTDFTSATSESEDPEHIAMLRSLLDLGRGFEFDSMLRFVDVIPAFNIDPYFELDLRLGWKVNDNFELSLVGQNLLHSSHEEYIATFVNLEQTKVQRGGYIKATWKF